MRGGSVEQVKSKQELFDQALAALYSALDEVNQFRAEEHKIEKKPDVHLLGSNGVLDSLAAVNFIVAAEMAVEEVFGLSLNLADDRAIKQEQNPFSSLGTLADYIVMLVQENGYAGS
jgi:acyl carrier protein